MTRMYVRALDSLEVKPLTGTEVVRGSPPPFWSFDSRYIVFASGGKLKRADISGTPPQSICDGLQNNSQGSSWNRDGVIVFAGGRNPSQLQRRERAFSSVPSTPSPKSKA
jgi:Tol biopolymer transport system component